jgi:radical SAM superfamily enzyme YgiQ (UPF0313 family)
VTDVLLGHAYFLRFDPKLWEARQPYPPLGTLYAAATLREGGFGVALFDAMLAGSEDDWAAALDRHRPRFATLYEDSFSYLSKMCLLRMREAALSMVAMAKRRGLPTVVAGSDATDHPEIYLRGGADFVILGEGEQTLSELLGALSGRRPAALEDIAGLAFARGGALVRTAPRPFIRDLDALPLPARDLADLDRYRRIWRARHGYFSTNLVTTRGCPYHCNWCAKPIYGQRYAVRSPASVADEMAGLAATYAPDHLSFVDDIFGLQRGWVERFADEVAARCLAVPFKCLSRADLLRAPVVGALRRAGCRTVWIGAESGSQRVLDAMEKGIRVEQIRDAARLLHEAGIEVGFFLQFGYPGETREDIEKTLELVRDCRPDDIGVSVSYPLPGTRFYERVRAQLREKRNWTDSSDLDMMYRGPFTTRFYRALHRVVHAEFRLRRLASRPWGRRPLRSAAALVWTAATLPLARLRLERAARAPHQGVAPLAPALTPEGASRPTEQEA